MDHALTDLNNACIAAAKAEGEFYFSPGARKPLSPCEDPENVLLNRLIRENGAVPECVSLTRELKKLCDELADTSDRTARHRLMKDMSMMEARIAIARKSRSR